MLIEVRKSIYKQSENFNKDVENIKRYEKITKLMNVINELENLIEALNSTLNQEEEKKISEPDNKAVEFIQ